MKKVLDVVLIATLVGSAFAQAKNRYEGFGRVAESLKNELKDVWVEPEEDFKMLTERAMRDDPQALYALARVCKAKGMWADFSKYLDRASELGYVKAQLWKAVMGPEEGWLCGAWIVNRRGSLNDLQKARTYCKNAVAAGYLCATNLIPFIDKAIQERESFDLSEKLKKEEQERMARELRLAEARQNGKNRPFRPFIEDEKIAFDEALAKAETNDAAACYWLAYYFAKGEKVEWDGDSALKFLKKAVDANSPAACYTFGLLRENYELQDENGKNVDAVNYFWGMDFMPLGGWRTLDPQSGNKCLTNKVAVANVESLYQKAVAGGLFYATNDIARLRLKVAQCERRIAQNEGEKKIRIANGGRAKSLMRDSLKVKDGESRQAQGETRPQDEKDHKARGREEELEEAAFSTWPCYLGDEEAVLHSDLERKFNCVYYEDSSPRNTTNTWFRGCGKSLIVKDDSSWCHFWKIDSNGQIVAFGHGDNNADLEELRWYYAEREKRLDLKKAKWAEEHGMTLDEAKRKYDNAKFEMKKKMRRRRRLSR